MDNSCKKSCEEWERMSPFSNQIIKAKQNQYITTITEDTRNDFRKKKMFGNSINC